MNRITVFVLATSALLAHHVSAQHCTQVTVLQQTCPAAVDPPPTQLAPPIIAPPPATAPTIVAPTIAAPTIAAPTIAARPTLVLERAPSLAPPIVLLAIGGAGIISGALLSLAESDLSFSYYGDDEREPDVRMQRLALGIAGVGTALVVSGVIWLITRLHQRRAPRLRAIPSGVRW
ncbi:MAG: hypothetical protein AAGE52_18050 [Myxococcota bacterium]